MHISAKQLRLVSLMLVLYYVIIAWVFQRNGFEHTERLFFTQKLKMLFEYDENTLITLGTTFPTIPFLINIVFAPFGYLFAPIAASIVATSLLFYYMVYDAAKSALPVRTMYISILALFMLHPQFIYIAVSGRNVAVLLFCFYMLFRLLFLYYETQVTFYLSLASLALGCVIFSEINFLWLVLSFMPFIVLVSLEGIKVSKDEPPAYQYFQALNNRSLRRKLVNRTISIYFVLFLLPMSAYYMFRSLNQVHAGNPNYFLLSQYSNWRVTGLINIKDVLESGSGENMHRQLQIVFQLFTVFLAPIFLSAMFLFKGKLYKLLTILTPLLLITILLIDLKVYLTVEYYMIIPVIAIVSLNFTSADRYRKPIAHITLLLGTILTIWGGFYYFKETSDFEEQLFTKILMEPKEWLGPKVETEYQELAGYLQNMASPDAPVLIDDAIAYSIVAHLPSLQGLVMPMQRNYITVVENPALAAQYVCIAKRINRLHNFSSLNAYTVDMMKIKTGFTPTRVFETKNWIIYSIR